MGKMEQLFHIFQQVSSVKKRTDTIRSDGQPVFDSKFKIIIKQLYKSDWLQMVEWVNSNSNGLVEIKFNNGYGSEAIYIGFVDPDDALFFKIKYST